MSGSWPDDTPSPVVVFTPVSDTPLDEDVFSSAWVELPGEGIIAIPLGWGVATPKFTVVAGGAMFLVTFGS